jgi:hypothetical protein
MLKAAPNNSFNRSAGQQFFHALLFRRSLNAARPRPVNSGVMLQHAATDRHRYSFTALEHRIMGNETETSHSLCLASQGRQ